MKQHSPGYSALVSDAKTRIKEIAPSDLKIKLDGGDNVWLIDVREGAEWQAGYLPQAMHLSKGIVEGRVEKHIPDLTAPIVVYCHGGSRSALVADNLQKMGYQNVQSLAGGFSAWVAAEYPQEK